MAEMNGVLNIIILYQGFKYTFIKSFVVSASLALELTLQRSIYRFGGAHFILEEEAILKKT